jgi:hypothetical protein
VTLEESPPPRRLGVQDLGHLLERPLSVWRRPADQGTDDGEGQGRQGKYDRHRAGDPERAIIAQLADQADQGAHHQPLEGWKTQPRNLEGVGEEPEYPIDEFEDIAHSQSI